jgi:hypothetical protein
MSGLFQFRIYRWLFQRDRLASKLYAWLFALCIALFIWLWTSAQTLESHSHDALRIRLSLAILLLAAIAGMFFLWIGMWWYWATLDDSGKWAKRFWFLMLLFGVWFGGAMYYVCVYLPQAIGGRAGNPSSRTVETESALDEPTRARFSWHPLMWLATAWWCGMILLVAAMTFAPRVIARIPHFEYIRFIVPIALVASLAYALWVLYASGMRRAGK